jgi:predicted nucleic-acid-binding Zn-ribbon protein
MFGFGTKCPKCGGGSFKLQEVDVQGAAYKMYAVQCTGCTSPIGVTEYYDSGSLLKKQEKVIAGMQQQLSNIEAYVQRIAATMR